MAILQIEMQIFSPLELQKIKICVKLTDISGKFHQYKDFLL